MEVVEGAVEDFLGVSLEGLIGWDKGVSWGLCSEGVSLGVSSGHSRIFRDMIRVSGPKSVRVIRV